MSSAIKTPAFQAKASNILNEDNSSIYSAGEWSFKNASAVTGFHVDADGKVGVGTSSPTLAKLTVVSTGNADEKIISAVANNQTQSVDLGYYYINQSGGSSFQFQMGGTERMRIDASGRLLVGTTNAVAKHVVYGSGTVQWIEINGISGTLVQFRNSQAAGGNITIAAGGGTSYNTAPSDYRLKEQVQDLGGGLEKVKQLRPVSFKWKESGKEDFGFIAHEIASVIPECVTGDKDAVDAEGKPEYQSIFPAPAQMIASLVSAIQEQQAMIEELKAKVSALESK